MRVIRNLFVLLKTETTYTRYSLLAGALYGCLYYWSTGYISIESNSFNYIVVNQWISQSFKLRAPFLWEPVAQLSTRLMTIKIAPLNIALMVLLALLVFINLFVFILSVKKPTSCQLTSKKQTVFALIPALFTGFTCCAPTFIIAFIGIIGTSASTFILVTRWAIPVSLILLIYGAYKGTKQIII